MSAAGDRVIHRVVQGVVPSSQPRPNVVPDEVAMSSSSPRPVVPVLRGRGDEGRGCEGVWDLFSDLVPGRGSEPVTHTPRWQQERAAEKATRRREEVAEATCRCGAPILTADASGAMPVRLDPAPVEAAGYVVAELSGRAVWGARETTPGRRVVDDYWPAHPGDPPAHVDVTWHATHRCPTTTATDGTEPEGNR